MKKIMLMAHDPGGANAILALVPELEKKGYMAALYGKGPALKRYRHFGLTGCDIDSCLPKIDVDSWKIFLQAQKPDFIITGTSGDDFSERYLWVAARECGVTAFAVMDQWINYGLRFSEYGLSSRETYLMNKIHPYLPDFIMVMDEEARREMVDDGFPADRVVASGQPYFDVLSARKEQFTESERFAIRNNLGIAPDDYLIVFVSESIRQDYSVAPGAMPYWGYDEISIFQALHTALQELTPAQNVHILIKQHPLERENGYREICRELQNSRISISVMRDGDPWDLLLASDLVCGMSSMLLLEAVLFNKPVLSIQIGLGKENPFVLDRKGIIKSILTSEDLQQKLRLIINEDFSGPVWAIGKGAPDRIIKYMEEIICRN